MCCLYNTPLCQFFMGLTNVSLTVREISTENRTVHAAHCLKKFQIFFKTVLSIKAWMYLSHSKLRPWTPNLVPLSTGVKLCHPRLRGIRGWVPFLVQSNRGWVPFGVESFLFWVPFDVKFILCWTPFRVQTMRGWVPFGVESTYSMLSLILSPVHSEFSPVPDTASYIRGWIQMVLAPNDLFSWNNKYNKYNEYNATDTFTCFFLGYAH